jgi:hypothetical protein
MAKSNRMDLSVYEHLLAVNAGFAQVRHALAALAERRGFKRGEMARFDEMTEETRSAICSYLASVIEMAETQQAGRLPNRRRAREREEEG